MPTLPTLPALPFELSKRRVIIIAIIAGIILGGFAMMYFGLRLIARPPSVNISVWGVFDDNNSFRVLLEGYKKVRPNVTVIYTSFTDEKEYERVLIKALAAGSGPDVFMIQNNWLPKHQDILMPFDANLQEKFSVPYVKFRDSFPKVVTADFTINTDIYAFPLYLDTLAMFYNRDYFDRKSIALVPSTWTEFERAVPELREIDPATNEVIKAAAAIGGSDTSINRSTDLLTVIMMQLGAEFTDNRHSRATFAGGSGNHNPGLDGLKFYTKFANPLSPFYTWNERFLYSTDSFAAEKSAIMFNFAHAIPTIRSKNPFLDFRIAPLPQPAGITQPVNYSNYWGLAVSKQSYNSGWAWDFITITALNDSILSAYSLKTKRPPALLTLIDKNLNDKDLGVFARQALTARSWWQKDNIAIQSTLSNMISQVIQGELTSEISLKKAEDTVSFIMRQK